MQLGVENSVLSCGDDFTAAIAPNGKVVCWGARSRPEIWSVPIDLENVVAVSCGSGHTAALT
jgi:3-mercaptopyruvate sulfurtransferase SseA